MKVVLLPQLVEAGQSRLEELAVLKQHANIHKRERESFAYLLASYKYIYQDGHTSEEK